jgi:predicted dehydrogenase
MIAPALVEREALGSMVEEFAGSITTGRTPLTDGRSGLRVLEILEAASRSLAEGGALIPVGVSR